MTDERKNEIWAMLDEQCQAIAKDIYLRGNPKCAESMEQFFGRHNLTAQVVEKPKEPRFKVGDWVRMKSDGRVEMINAILPSEFPNYPYQIRKQSGCLGYYDETQFEPYTEPNSTETTQKSPSEAENEPNLSDSADETTQKSQSAVDYAQYRLDLAKEIAVKMIGTSLSYDDIPHDSVWMANEIVKRLKETEE